MKFATTLEFLIVEQVKEVGDKITEQSTIQSMPNSRLELDKEFVLGDFTEVKFIGFLGIVFDTIVELFTEVLGSTFL